VISVVSMPSRPSASNHLTGRGGADHLWFSLCVSPTEGDQRASERTQGPDWRRRLLTPRHWEITGDPCAGRTPLECPQRCPPALRHQQRQGHTCSARWAIAACHARAVPLRDCGDLSRTGVPHVNLAVATPPRPWRRRLHHLLLPTLGGPCPNQDHRIEFASCNHPPKRPSH
jgi:hypothetical protein